MKSLFEAVFSGIFETCVVCAESQPWVSLRMFRCKMYFFETGSSARYLIRYVFSQHYFLKFAKIIID